MNLHRRNISDVFNIEISSESRSVIEQVQSPSSSTSDVQTTNDSNYLLTTNYYRKDLENDSSLLDDSSKSMKNNIRRWSMNIAKSGKNRKNMYQKTIRFMPSRMTKTISVDGDLITSQGNDIDQITQEIEQREHLMEDNPISEQMRIATIKSMPQTLTIKRQIRANVSKTITRRTSAKSITFLKKFKYSIKLYFGKMVKFTKHMITNFEIFYGSMKEIEGHFGSRVGAYFKFLRWLLMLNFLIVLLTFWFVTFPQILLNSSDSSEAYNSSLQSVAPHHRSEFYYADLFTAEGFFTKSILFYGGYSNTSFSVVEKGSQYSLPFAYFLTMVCLYLATFILVSMSMARSYRRSFIETTGNVQNVLTHKIFCSWDFGISNEKAAHLKHSNITIELKEILEKLMKTHEKLTKMQKFRIVSSHIAAHFIVFLMISGLCVGVWTLLQSFGETEHLNSWSALYVSLCINGTMLLFQIFFQWIAKMEEYRQANTTLNINLMRNFLLEIVIIGVLLTFWLSKTYTECWETSIGQEIYRLIITDFIISIILTSCVQGIRYVIYRNFWRSIDLPEFCIATNSLGLVYNQTLLWVGLLFAPFLAIIVAFKMVFVFFIKKYSLIYFCKPPTKMWRSSQTQTLFLVLTFVSLFGVIITHGYIITHVTVSKECGPFRGHMYMFQIFMEGILKLKEEHLFWKIFVLSTKPAVFGGILLTMCVIAYYLRAKSKAQIAKVKLLKELLCLEAKDKEFLLANISKITRGKEWVFDEDIPRRTRTNSKFCADECSTWKYEESPRKVSQQNGNLVDEPSTSSGYQRIDDDDETLRLRRL